MILAYFWEERVRTKKPNNIRAETVICRLAAESVHVNVNTRSMGGFCMLREAREEWGRRNVRCGTQVRFPHNIHTLTHAQTATVWVAGDRAGALQTWGGREGLGRGTSPVVSYKSVCDMSRHAEGNQMYSNAHKFNKSKRKISRPTSSFLSFFFFKSDIHAKTYIVIRSLPSYWGFPVCNKVQ